MVALFLFYLPSKRSTSSPRRTSDSNSVEREREGKRARGLSKHSKARARLFLFFLSFIPSSIPPPPSPPPPPPVSTHFADLRPRARLYSFPLLSYRSLNLRIPSPRLVRFPSRPSTPIKMLDTSMILDVDLDLCSTANRTKHRLVTDCVHDPPIIAHRCSCVCSCVQSIPRPFSSRGPVFVPSTLD